MFTLGIIPARAGSKGIKNKNIYQLCGRPLIEYTLESADQSNLNDVIITTDCPVILDMYSNDCIERPKELCEDNVPMLPVIQHAIMKYQRLNRIQIDAVCLLQPTSPLRTYYDINNALEKFNASFSDSLYSGYYIGIKTKEKAYDKRKTAPHFQRNGAIFISTFDLIFKGQIWSDNVIEFEMPKWKSIDIDDMDDMKMTEAIMKHGGFL